MTEFDETFIEQLEGVIGWKTISKSHSIADAIISEFQRLQARVQELEQERRWIHQDKTLILKKDGDSWGAVMPDFKDLQQSESRWFSGDISKYMDAVYWYLNGERLSKLEEE